MSKVVRHRLFELEGGEGPQIRLKKWSAGKLFLLVREFWSLLEEALDGIDLAKLNEFDLIRRLVGAFVTSEKKAARLVATSVDQPSDLTEETVLEWDADDFLNVVTQILDMNVTEELVKNFRKLLESFAREKAEKQEQTERSKKTTEPQPAESGA